MTACNEVEKQFDDVHNTISAGQIIGLQVRLAKYDVKVGWVISDSKNDPC